MRPSIQKSEVPGVDLVAQWNSQGLTVWQIVQKTGYPKKIVVALLADPYDVRALRWVRRHAASMPVVVPSSPAPAPAKPTRVSRVSYERVQPFLGELLSEQASEHRHTETIS